MLWTKRAHQCTIFQTFECSNERSINSSCHFWSHEVRVYSNSASLFSVMKDNSSVFFSSNLIYFGQKEPIEVKFSDFWVVGWNFTKLLMSYLKPQVGGQRSCLSWHWNVMQNLKKNWLVVGKTTQGIWQIFTRTPGNVKIGTLIWSFCPK